MNNGGREIALAALLLLLGCAAKVEPGRAREEPLPMLVAQRVTATVQRDAVRLVRLETEHEAFLTTPEHPFATFHSGWVSAGRLAPGDWVVSERFGAVRLLSVRSEPAPRPVPVFNLSVASSHAYLVGTDRVLVHNTNCQPNPSESDEEAVESREEAIARAIRERDEINREIQALTDTTRIAELRTQREELQTRIGNLRQVQRIAQRQGASLLSDDEPTRQRFEAEAAQKALSREEAIARAIREREELNREIQALTNAALTSPEMAELKTQRDKLQSQIGTLRKAPRGERRRRAPPLSADERAPQPPSKAARTGLSPEEAIAGAIRAREELNREIKALMKAAPASPRIAELRTQRNQVQSQIGDLRKSQGGKQGQGAPPSSGQERSRQPSEAENHAARTAPPLEEPIAQAIREREALNLEIKALRKTTPTSPRIAELTTERDKLKAEIDNSRKKAQRSKQREGAPPLSGHKRSRQHFEAENHAARTAGTRERSRRHFEAENHAARTAGTRERSRRHFEAENEAARKALEDAQKELAELESRRPNSRAEQAAVAARTAELTRQIPTLERAYQRTSRILTWLRELAEHAKSTPVSDTDRRALEERMQELSANLNLERKRANDAKTYRKQRADPERWRKRLTYERNRKGRLLRTAAYVNDTTRPRDALELLEDELAGLLQQAPSESRDARIHHLTEQIDTKKRLVEVRRESNRLRYERRRAQGARQELIAEGGDTREIDKTLAQVDLARRALRTRLAELRVQEALQALLADLDGTPWPDAPGSVDEAQLREFERQLDAGSVDEQQLADIEQALDVMNPADADLHEDVLDEADDVDEVLSDREDLLRQSPSPERPAALQANFERLQRELREERRAYETAMSALVNERAHIQNTQASSSSGATWQQRLSAVEAEMVQLRADRRTGLEERLDSVRRQLNLVRSVEVLRDEAIEAELTGEIALLERELQNDGG